MLVNVLEDLTEKGIKGIISMKIPEPWEGGMLHTP